MRRVSVIYQLFLKRDTNSSILLMITNVTDDLLMVGTRPDLYSFVELLGKMFSISKSLIDEDIRFNGYTIRRDDLATSTCRW